MNIEEHSDIFWYWLCNIDGIGRGTIAKLLEEYETPKNIYYENDDAIMKFVHRNNRIHISNADYTASKNMDRLKSSYELLNKRNVSFIHRASHLYPEKLKNIPDPPYGL